MIDMSVSPAPSILSILLALMLVLGLAAGSAGLPPVKSVCLDYTYSATYNAMGQAGQLSAGLSLKDGTAAFHFSDGENSLSLQDGGLDLPGLGLSQEEAALAAQMAQYAFDGRLQKDLASLRPYFNDLLSYNAYDMQVRSLVDGCNATQYTIDTSPLRLLGALQRWIMIRGTDPQWKAALDQLEIAQLPLVRQWLPDGNDTFGAAVSSYLLLAGTGLSSALCGSMYGAEALKMRIHAECIVVDGQLRSGMLQIGDPEEMDDGIWLEVSYQSADETDQAHTASLILCQDGKTLISASADWVPHVRFNARGTWLFPAGGSYYSGGDLSFQCLIGQQGLDSLGLHVSVYDPTGSPSFSLSYEDHQLSFLYIQNPSYYHSYSENDLPSFLRASLFWDSDSYTLFASGSRFEASGGGTYERTGDGFHQKGEVNVKTWPSYGAEPTAVTIRLEQDFTFGPHNFRLIQHLDAGTPGTVPVLTYDDRHSLTLR